MSNQPVNEDAINNFVELMLEMQEWTIKVHSKPDGTHTLEESNEIKDKSAEFLQRGREIVLTPAERNIARQRVDEALRQTEEE